MVPRPEFAQNLYERIRQAQQVYGVPRKPGSKSLKWVVPAQDRQLVNRILTVAHGAAEHRSKRATKAFISDSFVWKGMEQDTDKFVAECILLSLIHI